MSEIQLLFTCVKSGGQSSFEKAVSIEAFQVNCFRNGLKGFFLPHGNHIIGLFEGEEGLVFSQMERLVRSRHFNNIDVIREHVPETLVCQHWYGVGEIPAHVDVQAFLSPEYLAEFVNCELKPLQKVRRH